MKTQINLKIDEVVKNEAQKTALELGLSLSSVVNATLKQFSKTRQLNLSVAPRINDEMKELVLEAREEYKKGRTSGPFSTSEDLFKHLGI